MVLPNFSSLERYRRLSVVKARPREAWPVSSKAAPDGGLCFVKDCEGA